MERIRSFIAITLPGDIHEMLTRVIGNLKKDIGDQTVRWVNPTNIHLTLKFLGEIPENNIAILKEQLEQGLIDQQRFPLSIGKIGAFPAPSKPRVIWVGVAESDDLMQLQRHVEIITHKLGYESEGRSYSAHLTLGRVDQHASPRQLSHCGDVLSSSKVGGLGSFIVQSIEIYRSILTAGGAVYSRLYSISLKQ
jgi:2'-5' RNA ligase